MTEESPKTMKTTVYLEFTGECSTTDGAFHEAFITRTVALLHQRTDVCTANYAGLCQPRNYELVCSKSVSRTVRAVNNVLLRVTAWLPQK